MKLLAPTRFPPEMEGAAHRVQVGASPGKAMSSCRVLPVPFSCLSATERQLSNFHISPEG